MSDSDSFSGLSPVKRALLALDEMQGRLDRIERDRSEPIAVVGMACRLPGGADTPERLWAILRDGVDAVTEVPAGRWDADAFYDPDADAPGKMYSKAGAFLASDVETFDAAFFGIAPREAAAMDPQQRLLLEVAWEALERAGYAADSARPGQTGVFVGISTSDYSQILTRRGGYSDISTYSGTGNAMSIAAGRIAYLLGLHGPAISLDTACSSSLVAVHLACQSLRLGESDLALAAGVNLMLTPEPTICLARMRVLAVRGRCRTFDASADGFVRGEGAATVVLKRVSDAMRDRDQILALIRGSAVNHDGRSGGLTAPNGPAQESVIRKALANARVEPREVGCIEAHGTGTPLGDPIEVHALAAALAAGRETPFFLGSAKTNFGHLEAAAGVLGLMKVILTMQHGRIPPLLHQTRPNPHVDWESVPAVLPLEIIPWERSASRRRIAGVSAFGISGTNAHVVLEEAEANAPLPAPAATPDRPRHILALSAPTASAVAALAARFSEHLGTPASGSELGDACFSANTGRPHFARRLAVTGRDSDEMRTALEAAVAETPSRASEEGKLAFLFPGQGSQYSGMSRSLRDAHPPFRETIDRCARIWDARLPHSLASVLFEPQASALLDETRYTQPALFSVELALALLWRSWGIEPQAVLGHSVGEYAAAAVAGILSVEDALELVIERGLRMQALPEGGRMAAVAASESAVAACLASHPENSVSIAAVNSPSETVLSGDQAALGEVLHALESAGFAHRILATSHAFHSALIEPALEHLTRAAARLPVAPAMTPFVSNLTGEFADGALLADPGYWARHARNPVRFADGVRALAERGFTRFLEIGPGSALASLGRRTLEEDGRARESVWLSSLRRGRDDWSQILETLARLSTSGSDVDWEEFDRPFGRRRVALPTYPFERARHWMSFTRRDDAPARGSILGTRLSSPAFDGTVHQTILGIEATPFLAGHRTRGLAVVPAAVFVELACLAAADLFGEDRATMRDLKIEEALILPDAGPVAVQVIVGARDEGGLGHPFRIVSGVADAGGRIDDWRIHATGAVTRCEAEETAKDATTEHAAKPPAAEQAHADGARGVSPDDLYEALAARGAVYEGPFRSVAELWTTGTRAIARVERPPEHPNERGDGSHKLDPCLLDGCFQIFAALLRDHDANIGGPGFYLPVGVERVDWLAPLPPVVECHLTRRESTATAAGFGNVAADLTLRAPDGTAVARVVGLTLKRVASASSASPASSSAGTAAPAADDERFLYRIEWEVRTRTRQRSRPEDRSWPDSGRWLLVVSGADRRLAERLAERLIAAGQVCEIADAASPDAFPRKASGTWRGAVLLPDAPESPRPGAFGDSCAAALGLTQALASAGAPLEGGLWLVTRGALWVDGTGSETGLRDAGLAGLARVIALEHPELGCVNLDLDPTVQDPEADAARLFEELEAAAETKESQIAWRGDRRHVPRLTRIARPATDGDRDDGLATQLVIGSRGALDQLTLVPIPRPSPGPGQVEIRVRATGLNFRDVLNALGMYPGDPGPLGLECSGTITRVGDGVDGLAEGDRVIAFSSGSFRDHLVADAGFVVPMAPGLSFEQGATIPIVFLTAYHALHRLAKVAPGERVLIHAAAGGVGMAAVQLALGAGAEVFGTAGTKEKRSRLEAMGVHHVMDSRSLDFADEVMALTSGRGVDVVLNSLVGEYIPRSMAILAPKGRFVEIGKIEIWDDARVAALRDDISYSSFDLGEMAANDPADVQSMFRSLSESFDDGSLSPLPHTAFSVRNAVDAFRFMAQSRHMGKVVIVQDAPAPAGSVSIREDRTYLVTGGLGGLGLEIAKWLAARGARYLVLVGRFGATSPAASDAVRRLEDGGARVLVHRADVADPEATRALFARIDRELPPLAGLVHAAGQLDDALIADQSPARFAAVMRPKIDAAWNLHRESQSNDRKPDFFVTFSSTAAVLGSPGQANYAAANSAMDALAHLRRSRDLPAQTINWGPWASVGMASAASSALQRRWSAQGLEPLSIEAGLDTLARSLSIDEAQLIAVDADWGQLLRRFPAGSEPRLLSRLAPRAAASGKPAVAAAATQMARRIQQASAEDRERLVSEYIRAEAAKVLGFGAADAIDPAMPLHDMGFDSLMAIELSNAITSLTGRKFSPATLLETPTIREIALTIATQWPSVPDPQAAPVGAQVS